MSRWISTSILGITLAASLLLSVADETAVNTAANAGDWGNFEVETVGVAESAASARPPRVEALFDLSSLSRSPFPSDIYTVADATQRTGRRVNLPLPDCSTNPSDCNDLAVVNTMDGFNLLPRISIPFDGPIDPSTVASSSVYLVELAQEDGETVVANTVGINQVVWDPATLTLHVESDDVLRQTARYAAIVTNGILDTGGRAVKASQAFKQIVNEEEDPHLAADLQPYRAALIATMDALEAVGVPRETVVAASVFTTETATATLENVRGHLKSSPAPAPANFAIGPNGSRAVFPLSSLQSITFRQHTGTNTFVNAAVPVAALRTFAPES